MSTPTQQTPVGPRTEYFPDRERRNPWFRFVVHLGAPISVSLLLHAGILAVLAWVSLNLTSTRGAEEFQAAITDAADLSGGLKWPGEAELRMDPPAEIPMIEPVRFSDPSSLADLARSSNADETSGGFGIGESGRAGIIGTGSGAGESGVGGLGSGFGAGSGLGSAAVWSLSASGNKFAYVVDFSGSIIVAEDDLKRELKRSIGALKPTMEFAVLVFFSRVGPQRDEFVTEAFAPTLIAADADSRRRFFDWLDRKKPMGSTEPLAAMKRALALKPDAVFFFSDGYFDDKVVDEIARANEGRRTQIHCLVFDELLLQDATGSPRLTDGARRLQKIADQNRGRCKLVTGVDLRRS